ncbi:hypothetical protein [Actinocorallia populi]|uniref:hypothetical protein n=1 Tax=Actinocorallia populi TaxID=2079200 RepID=UPI001300BEB9|nr:hypothetical protein [Actinocorallia populi]
MDETRWAPDGGELGRLWAAAAEAAGGAARGARTTYLDVQRAATTVAAEVDVEWPDGRRTAETFGAGTSSRARGALRMSDGVHEIGVWRFPYDPALPGLPRAFDAERMRSLLTRLGLDAAEPRLSVRAYRPLRRAVIEVRTPRTSVFVKVLRPERVEAVHRLHRAATGGRAPESLGWTDDGLLVLAGLGGRPLRRILLEGDPDELDPAELVAVLRELPAAFAEHTVRPDWADKARHYADVVSRVLPDAASTAHAVADAVVLSLATGAHRVQDPDWRAVLGRRLALAGRWCRGEGLLAA